MNLFFDNVDVYDVCMLTCSYLQTDNNYNNQFSFLKKVFSASNAAGYMVNYKYLDKLIDLYENALPSLEQTGQHWIYANDQIWKQLQKKDIWYIFFPKLGKQKAGYSDNSLSFQCYDE